MWKKVITICVFVVPFLFLGNSAEAYEYEVEPLFVMGDVVITEFGVHYIEGFGEFELTPTEPVLITPFTSIQGSANVTLNRTTWTNITTFTRNQPNNNIQVSHTHNGTVQFRVQNTAQTQNSFTFSVGSGVTVTRNLGPAVLFGQQARLQGMLPSNASHATIAMRVNWWIHP